MTFISFDFFGGAAFWFAITLVTIGIVIFFEKRNPQKTMTWLLVLILLPGIGFILYLLFGENLRKRSIKKAQLAREKLYDNPDAKVVSQMIKEIDNQKDWIMSKESNTIFNQDDIQSIRLLMNSGNTPVTMGNKVTLFTEGVAKFDSLLNDIKNAKDHIHMEYYIIKDDELGNRIKDALIIKAKEGVEVRVLYDDFGCYSFIYKKKFIKELKSAGVELRSFLQDRFLIYRNINYRNHRKIVIIDGHIGYVGGINIGDEYVHKHPKFGYWRDTHLRLEGNAVSMLQSVFLQDWFMRTKEMLIKEKYFKLSDNSTEGSVIQIATSGADTKHATIYQSYFYSIAHAKESVYIQTPYFIPDEPLMTALKTALLSGVDVRLMFPGSPDHFTVYNASHSYIDEIIELGAKVYFYQKGFIHSKVMLVDREYASVGTANMDVRSFMINAEINAIIYDDETVHKLYDMFEDDIKDCTLAVEEEYLDKSVYKKIVESLCRLFSPIL